MLLRLLVSIPTLLGGFLVGKKKVQIYLCLNSKVGLEHMTGHGNCGSYATECKYSKLPSYWFSLRRQMGGEIPRTVDIHNPRLDTKVSIDIPENVELDSIALYNLFRRENVIKMCMELLPVVPDWQYLVEGEFKKGKSLQLAWRVNANLDWVWLETDIEGNERDWAVLCGLAFKHVRQT